MVDTLASDLRRVFYTDVTLPKKWRATQLKALAKLVDENRDALVEAMKKDLGRSPYESVLGEIATVSGEISHAKSHLKSWMNAETVATPLAQVKGLSTASIVPQPLGVVLIITPWNYPVSLPLNGLVAAIAAGNCVVLKPSEISQHSTALLAKLIPIYLDPACVRVILGGVDESTILLKQKWDHIMYTGNGVVGKIIMRAAAEHLTPVTLELGGKSPTYVDKGVDLQQTARRVAWGKFFNAGQTCIAPDYVLVHNDVKAAFLAALKDNLKNFYGEDPSKSADFARIISERHCHRLETILKGNADQVVYGGQVDVPSKYIAPTVVDVPYDQIEKASVMQEELFGPILPVIGVENVGKAIEYINGHDKPLALYVFSSSNATQQEILLRTSSGSAVINDAIVQYSVCSLPFGGVGASGMGSYHGEHGFKTFSHMRAVLNKSTKMDLSVRYPPYDMSKIWLIEKMM
eukprot:TRINITY_DN2310_c0_g1_i5.p1 TRINITY_DN2310_c0_g1~~TRINITY_DN2310_c0_g1_i5.p1  ORF type:complete len:492 (-),score=126.97 TRINITY_DN2310_c0_g1_i5:72-1457(-)